MATLMTKVRRLIREAFPGAELKLDPPSATSRITGMLSWEGFMGHDQIERQREVRQVLRKGLSTDEQARLSAILTMTPAEMQLMRAG